MPDELLNLNLGQVQAVIAGYSEKVLDAQINAIWTGYYASYYFSKHPKKPTQLIKHLIDEYHKGNSKDTDTSDVDLQHEIDVFAQRDLKFLEAEGGTTRG